MGYALTYHALKLYEMYHIGYGIISQQGKEAKHSAVKNDLKLSNRPNRTDKLCIFLNINHYHWHTSPTLSQEYVPPHCVSKDVSNSGRNKQVDGNVSHTCLQSQDIVKRAQQQKLSSQLVEIFKPYVCFNLECGQRVAWQPWSTVTWLVAQWKRSSLVEC